MNEEEKKAFKELSKKAVLCNYEERDYPNMICFKKDMLIVLNLIEKLQKENEELKQDRNNNYQMIVLAQNEALSVTFFLLIKEKKLVLIKVVEMLL